MKILLMNEDFGVRNVIVEMLEYLGHSIEAAQSTAEALSLVAENLQDQRPFDVAIVDLEGAKGMPGMLFAAKVKDIDDRIRTVMVSDRPLDNDRERVDMELLKPYSVNSIARCLDMLSQS